MNLHFFLLSILCAFFSLNNALKAEDNFWNSVYGAFFGPAVNYNKIQADVAQELDRIIFDKLEHVSPEMYQARLKLSSQIVGHIKEFNYDSQEKARQEALAAVKPAVKHFIIDAGAQKIGQEISNYYHGRPPYNPQQFEQRIKQELAQQVDDAFRKNKDITQLLKLSKLKEIIKQYDNQYEAPAGAPSVGLYPKLDNELPSVHNGSSITDVPAELYPQFNDKNAEGLERNKYYFGAFFQKVKQYRAQECPVCQEDFDAQRARVNLFCGHSLCATCLAGHIHINEKRDCPTCRQEVRKEEFSAQFLRKFINSVELKQQFPRMHEKIRRLFGF
jgi:hypothetical protein